MLLETFVLFPLFSAIAHGAFDYCSRDVCRHNYVHICCDFDGRFASRCEDGIRMLENTEEAKEIILHEHNLFRNSVASGREQDFDRAARMPVMTWDDELAYTAECNIKSCINNHDKCRSTEAFAYVGQNLYEGNDFNPITPESLYPRCIKKWTKESEKARRSDIKRLYDIGQIGHFTQVVQESANKVGCAAAWWRSGRMFEFRVVCNYNGVNMRDRMVYLPGPMNCTAGRSSKYPHLCSEREPQVSYD